VTVVVGDPAAPPKPPYPPLPGGKAPPNPVDVVVTTLPVPEPAETGGIGCETGSCWKTISCALHDTTASWAKATRRRRSDMG
jgi:hypothetical protein